MSPPRYRVLLVEDEPDIREVIAFTLESTFPVELVEASSGNQAIDIIRKDKGFNCIVSDYFMANGTGGDLFRFLASEKTEIPFILCSASIADANTEFQGSALKGYVEKPQIIEPLTRLMKEILGKGSTQPADPSEMRYCPIRLNTLARLGATVCDLHVRLSDAKYVCVMKAGEAFKGEDLARFRAKGIASLYIKRDDSSSIFDVLTRRILAVAQTKSAALDSIFEVSQQTHEAVHEVTLKMGLTKEAIALTQVSVRLAVQAIESAPELAQVFKNLKVKGENYLSAHSVVLAYACSGIASALGWASENTHQKLALAAYLHDLKLPNPELARYASLAELMGSGHSFTQDEISAFKGHPEEAAMLVREAQVLPEDVEKIVEQHHERPDGTGFPLGLTSDKINPLASIFIVAHDLVTFANRNEGGMDVKAFVARFGKSYESGFFAKILQHMAGMGAG